ncbi:hypothetical protein BALU111458_17750 [Bacillus luti]|uniref:hypothetical protein n=1 Tax=Bacillus luti TaxID=2026191 RepID=UPI000A5CE780|nr:hypothetical protein [Bacillus luti]
MNFIKNMLNGVQTQYLVKSYIISFILTGFLFYNPSPFPYPVVMTIHFVLACVLFPFATIVWDDLINTMMGNTEITVSIWLMFTWKIFKVLFLYIFSPLIAPIGMIYVYLANGYHKN